MSYFVLIWQASAKKKKKKKSAKKIIHANSNTSAMSKTDLAPLMKACLKRELRMIVNGSALFFFFSKRLMQHDLDAPCPEGSGQVSRERRAAPKVVDTEMMEGNKNSVIRSSLSIFFLFFLLHQIMYIHTQLYITLPNVKVNYSQGTSLTIH